MKFIKIAQQPENENQIESDNYTDFYLNTIDDTKIAEYISFVQANTGEYLVLRDLYFDGNQWYNSNPDTEWRHDERIPQGSILTVERVYDADDHNQDIPDVAVSVQSDETKLSGFDMNVHNLYQLMNSSEDLFKR